MIPYKSHKILPGSYELRSRPISEGFVWNHQSITSLIYYYWLLKRAFLSLFLSDYLTQSHNFINLVFVTSSLLHSIEVQMRPFKPSFVYHQSAKPRKSNIYLIRKDKNVVKQILHVDINNKTPKRIRWHPLSGRSAVRFDTRDQQPH